MDQLTLAKNGNAKLEVSLELKLGSLETAVAMSGPVDIDSLEGVPIETQLFKEPNFETILKSAFLEFEQILSWFVNLKIDIF